MTPFYFDIETIPAQDPAVREEIAAGITAPAQYKKPESIAEWLKENRESEAEAQWLKTSFDGGIGHVCCIAWAIGDGAPEVIHIQDAGDKTQEAAMLSAFFAEVSRAGPGHTYIGHNIIGFDLPFLWKRAMVLGVQPPVIFPRNPKPWSELVADTMLLWDPTQRAGGSMDRICRLFGLAGKGDISGADVWPLVKAGRIKDVSAYCCDDVSRTRAMHRRMTFA